MSEIETLKREKLDWQGAGPEAQYWWHRLELANRWSLEALLRVCRELVEREATIGQLHSTAAQFPSADMDALFRVLDGDKPGA